MPDTKMHVIGGAETIQVCFPESSPSTAERIITPREREVLPLVASGLLNRQAAAGFGITEVTNVMQKIEAASFADLVHIAEQLEIPITDSRRAGGN